MKTKVQAQRKFAQGAYVPPSTNTVTTLINRRVESTNEKVFRHNTSAKILLDSISFEGVHLHQPVVVLERLSQPSVPQDGETTQTIKISTPVVSNEINRTPLPTASKRILSLRRSTKQNSSCVSAKPKLQKANKKVATKKKLSKNYLLKRLRRKETINRKCNMKLRSARPVSVADTDFSVDDDKPLTHYVNRSFGKKRGSIKREQPGKKIRRDTTKSPLPRNESSHRNKELNRNQQRNCNDAPDPNQESSCNGALLHNETSNEVPNRKPNNQYQQEMKSCHSRAIQTSNENETSTNQNNLLEALNLVNLKEQTSNNEIYEQDSRNDAFNKSVLIMMGRLGDIHHSVDADFPETTSNKSLCPVAKEFIQIYKKETLRSNQNTSIADNNSNVAEVSEHNGNVNDDGDCESISVQYCSNPPSRTTPVNISEDAIRSSTLQADELFYGSAGIANWMTNNQTANLPTPNSTIKSHDSQNFKIPALPQRSRNNTQKNPNNDLGRMNDAQSESGSEISTGTVVHMQSCSCCKALMKYLRKYHKNVHRDGLTPPLGFVNNSLNNSISSLFHALETGQLATREAFQKTQSLSILDMNSYLTPIREVIAGQSRDIASSSRNITGFSGNIAGSPRCTSDSANNIAGSSSGLSSVFVSPSRNPATASKIVHPNQTAADNFSGRKVTRVTRRSGKAKDNEEQEIVDIEKGKIVKAPVYRPTEEEFRDPVAYFQSIMPEAAKFGLCKVVAPSGFKPPCTLTDSIRFMVTNQYIARFYSRWGPVTRELCALRSFLGSQNITFSHSPLLEGLEVNLPKMLQFVQRQDGLKANVKSRTYVDTRKWNRLAEELNYTKLNNPAKKLDQIYVKYLLPYDALTQRERQELTEKMDKRWSKRNDKLMQRAQNPLHRQKRLLGESDSSEDDDFEDNQHMTAALNEAEECVVRGRVMNLSNFKKIANKALKIFFPSPSSTSEIEAQYWKLVLLGNEHVCVNTASIDTGSEGYGFTKNKNEPYGKHPWNLKMLSQNKGNVLRSLGPVLGVTVPTLHVGMIYSTSCWHRDPHSLPWIEYMHTGPEKIWYGIPDSESANFRQAVESLCPTACQNKSIWLPSDIAMIPPTLLLERNVSMSRVVQNPGEYIIVFPKAYSCSICTGYTVSESVYFATNTWMKTVNYVFQELRQSCEPTMFSLEQLLISVARDSNTTLTMLQLVHESFSAILSEEVQNRHQLERHGLKARVHQLDRRNSSGSWNVHENECEVCRSTLYLSRVKGVFRKKYSVCLRHALQVLESKNKKIERRETETFELDYFFGNDELEEVISSIRNRLTQTTSTISGR